MNPPVWVLFFRNLPFVVVPPPRPIPICSANPLQVLFRSLHHTPELPLWVIVARGFHPFPSRTRKLSLSAPMVLHAQVCGRVGSRPIKQQKPGSSRAGLFAFLRD